MADDLHLADVLAALSVATDLGMGQEPEKAVRSCLVATGLARALGLPEPEVRDVYYLALLQHLGCTAPAHEWTHLFGDDLVTTPIAERTDDRNPREVLALLLAAGRGMGARRLGYLARAVASGKQGTRTVLRSVCEVGSRMSERLGLGEGVRLGLLHSLERWDGKGEAYGLGGDGIALPARCTVIATQSVIFDRLGGPDAAVEMVRRRAGGWFDPEVAAAFERTGPDLLRSLAEADVWADVLTAEPEPVRRIPAEGLDDVARVFADMVDLMTPFTLGHSSGVADLAQAAAERLGLPSREIHRAALLHDLGRVAVSGHVWERPGALSSAETEQVRLHPYWTERVLARSAALAPLARMAGMHHERQDGSGYHHGAAAQQVPAGARVLAAADAYQAMTQDRPHRAALDPAAAAAQVEVAARSGWLDPECAAAVIEAAGQRRARARGTWPAGLSDREVEVLRLVAKGLSNRQVAEALVISVRTAEHHVQHIYTKIGGSTRAAAALFAMEHGLLR
jgi:HD-GYP domain-containing protein (c-di-GMP phosphodiesterase class II)